MNEDYLKELFTHLGYPEDQFDAFKNDMSSNEEFNKQIFDHLGYDENQYDAFKNDTGLAQAVPTQEQPEQIPDTSKGVQAEVDGGGSASTSADTDSSSDLQSEQDVLRAPEGITRNTEVQLEGYDNPSTVLMSSHGDYSPPDADGKYVAFPTIFPKDPNNQTNTPEDWIVTKNEDQAYQIAKERGEVLYYDTPEEASKVAEGSWKEKQKTPESKEEGFWANKWREFKTGSSRLGENLASIPEGIYRAASIPQNAVADLFDIEWLKASPEKFKETWDVENPVLDYYKEETERLSSKTDKYYKGKFGTDEQGNTKRSAWDSFFEEGNYAQGFELLGGGIVESAPVSLSMMAGGASMSALKLTGVAAPAFVEGNMQQLKEANPKAFEEMSETERSTRAFSMAAAETAFMSIGTGTIGKAYKDVLKKEGAEKGKVIFKQGLIKMYETAFKKLGLPISAAGEGVEEVATTVTQNLASGKSASEGVGEAFLQGLGGGTLYGAPMTAAQAVDVINENVQERKVGKILKDTKYNSVSEVFTDDTDIDDVQIKIAGNVTGRRPLEKDLKKQVKEGLITQEQMNSSLDVFDETYALVNAVEGVDLTDDQKIKAVNLLKKKTRLERKVKDKDPNLVNKELEEIKNINSQLLQIRDTEAKAEDIKQEGSKEKPTAPNMTEEQIESERKKELENYSEEELQETWGVETDETIEQHINSKYDKMLEDVNKNKPLTKETFSEKLNKGKWGMLTAENPNAKPLSKEENKKRNKKARAWLEKKGYKPKDIKGKYEGNEENSFFVEDLSREDAVEFAKEFNQESVATSEGLVYQDGTFFPRTEGSKVGGKYDDMFSTIETADGNLDFKVDYNFKQKQAPQISPDNSSNYANMTEDNKTSEINLKSVNGAKLIVNPKTKENIIELPDGSRMIQGVDTKGKTYYEIEGNSKDLKKLGFDPDTFTIDETKAAETFKNALENQSNNKQNQTNEQKQQDSKTQETETATEATGDTEQETTGRGDTRDVQGGKELEALEKELEDNFSKTNEMKINVRMVKESLSKVLPDVEVTLHETEEDYHEAIGEEDNSAGAYDPKTKTIHINPNRADNSTAFHEAFHAILSEKLGDNVNEVGGIVDQMVDLLRDNVDIDTPIADGYPKGEVNEEALANLFGELAANWTSLKPKSRNLIQRLLDKLSKLLGLNKKITEDEVYDLLNTLSYKINYGKEIKEKDLKIFKGGKFRPNPKQGVKKQKYGAFEIDYIEDKLFDQYSKDGFIKTVQDPSTFAGMKAVATSPDNLFTGSLKLGDKTIFQGGGGIYFVLKYGDVWASSKGATNQMVRALNEARRENGGKVHLILTGGSKKKLFSSVSGVRGSLSITETLLRKGLVSKTDFKNAFTEAIKSEKGFIKMTGSTDNLINNLETYFKDKNTTTFEKRGKYIVKAISNLAKNKNIINNSDKIIKFLGGTPGKKIGVNDSKVENGKTRGLTDLIVEMLSEPITRGMETGDVYAAVEVTSDVYAERGQHESYPYHIKTTDGSKPKLILFRNATKGKETLVSNSGADYEVRQATSVAVEYKHPIKKQKKPKPLVKDLQKLVNYSRGRGYKDEIIKQALTKRGFSEADIDQALGANPFAGKSEKNQVNNLSSRLREQMKKLKSSERSRKRAQKIAKSRTAEFMASWEGAVDVVMDTMNLTGNPAQSLYEGLESFRKSDWYNSVSASGKLKAERMFKEEVGRIMPEDETAASFLDTVKATKNKLVDVASQKLIDKYIVLRKTLKENFNIYSDDVNFSQAEINMHGKAAEDLAQFEKQIEDVMKRATKQGFDPQQISDYLYAKHAEERNKHIKENIDPENEFGSGMTPAAIDKILNQTYNTEEIAKLDAIAEEFYAMIQQTRDMMLEFGMITEETHMNLTEYYDNYVPLKGFDNQDILGSNAIVGAAIDVKGNRLKRAAGRSTKADNVIASLIQQRATAVIDARKNEILMTLKNLAEQNPNNGIVELYRKDQLPTTSPVDVTGKKKTVPVDPSTKNGFVGVMVDGEQMYLRFDNANFAKILEGSGVEKADLFTRIFRSLNRYLSTTLTTLNPEFVISNFARDIQTAVMNISAEADINQNLKGKNLAGAVVRDTRRAISAIYKNERSGKKDTEFGKYYEEFKQNGAKTGWANQDKAETIKKNLNRLHKMNSSKGITLGSVKRGTKAAFRLVEDVNTSVENGVRLAAYINARKAGLTAPQAAAMAKELTVNFNKSGEFGPVANSFYLFFNAAIQGNVRFAKAMTTMKTVVNEDGTTSKKLNKAQKIAMGLTLFASMLTLLNQNISDDDEDGLSYYSKIPDYEKERNLIFMNPVTGKDYFKIPLPYGYNIFHNTGMIATEWASGDRSTGDALGFLTSSTIGAFSPISIGQGSDAANTIASAFTPTIAKPIVDLARNENYFGAQIYNEDFPFADKTSDASKGRRSTPTAFKEVAKFLNEITGGNTYEEGAVDVTPESLYYWFKFGIGGTGQFVTRGVETTSDLIRSSQGQEVDIETRKIPFVRKVAGEPSKYVDQTMYFERFDQLTRRQNAIQERLESGDYDSDDRSEMRDVSQVLGKYEAINKSLRDIRKHKKHVENTVLDPVRRTNELKELDEEYYELIKEANGTFNEDLGRNYFK